MADVNGDFLDEIATGGADIPDPSEMAEEAVEVEEVEEVAEPEAETVEAAETPAEVPTTPEVKEDKTVPLPALLAERDKRKELERKLAEFEAKNQQPQPEFYENPEAFVQMVEQRTQARIHAILEEQAREANPDYDDVMQVVLEAAQTNPEIQRQVFAATNPAVAAYKLGKQLMEYREMQNPEQYKAKLEAEIRAKLEAEYAAKTNQKAKLAQAVPPDLSQARNAGGQFQPVAPNVIDELFQRN